MVRSVWILMVLGCLATAGSSSAQDKTSPVKSEAASPAPPAAPASGEANSGLKVPPVFSKKKPETLADLREMEAHLKAVAAKVGPTVVGLQIGRAQGSGVIVTGDGYVLTAGHVSGAPDGRARVILPSGQVVEGRTLGRVRGSDAGLIKIQGERSDWPHTAMAAEGSIEEGEWCLTLGHPGGFNKERAAPLRFGRVLGTSPNTIQTDCELVGGDSGGPVFDMAGNVIGINSRIGPQTAMNFHVAIDVYREHWETMKSGEDVKEHSGAFLGIAGTKVSAGLKITKVFRDSPADKAGLKADDVLVTFQGKKVDELEQLIELVGEEEPGRKVRLQVLRDGKPKDFELTLAVLPD